MDPDLAYQELSTLNGQDDTQTIESAQSVKILELVRSDVCGRGPVQANSIAGSRYFVAIILIASLSTSQAYIRNEEKNFKCIVTTESDDGEKLRRQWRGVHFHSISRVFYISS